MTLDSQEKAIIEQMRTLKASQNAKGKFDKVWVDHNTSQDNKQGMMIHAKFSAKNLKDVPCRMAVYFYFDSGEKLKDFNNSYRAKDGQVSSGANFKPGYDNSTYHDLELFMPYDELHMVSGKHSLKFQLGLYVENGDFFAWSHYVHFTYNSGD
ncbi:MAG: hypothetical protein EAZ87_17160 [Nostocales cyanobacterium]|nr:MAG: hypothetical protein EAZ87_17160 [Nostocales cyanobacterium]